MKPYLLFGLIFGLACAGCSEPMAPDVSQPSARVMVTALTSTAGRFVVPGEISFRYDQRRWYATADGRRRGYVPLPVALAFARQGGGVVRFSLLPAGPAVTPKTVTKRLTGAFRGTDTNWSTVCTQVSHSRRGSRFKFHCETSFHTPSLKEKGLILVRYLTGKRHRILVVVGQWPEGRNQALSKPCRKMADSVRPADAPA